MYHYVLYLIVSLSILAIMHEVIFYRGTNGVIYLLIVSLLILIFVPLHFVVNCFHAHFHTYQKLARFLKYTFFAVVLLSTLILPDLPEVSLSASILYLCVLFCVIVSVSISAYLLCVLTLICLQKRGVVRSEIKVPELLCKYEESREGE